MGSSTFPHRSLWRRVVPPRIRLHAKLIAGSLVVVALIAVLLGTVQIRPIVFSKEVLAPSSIAHDVRGSVDLFDPTVPHDIAIELSNVEYEKLKADFVSKGEKTWVRADVTIDGTRLESVGIRLKGNSTLMSLRGGRGGGRGGGPPGPMHGAPPEGMPEPPPGLDGAPPTGGASMSTVSFDDPSTLPLVLGFDHFVKGRGFQGRTELAARPIVGTGGASLNEAVALQLIRESGQPSQRFTWVRFSLNGAAARTRLVLENPDSTYAVALNLGEGALFKSKSTSSFTYKGEDPTEYTGDFDQLSAKGSRDLAPVISLLQFVETSTDEAFDAELARWIDVESFARYVATHDLLDNFDDMSGPGRNFLLWYDAGDRRFSVITWDMNLAITGMGGGARPGGGMPSDRPALGDGARPGNGGKERPRSGPGDGGMRIGNALKTRFLASEGLAAVRATARAELAELWFESGGAERVTRELASTIPETESLSREGIDAEAENIVTRLRARSTAVSTSSAR